MMTSITFLSCQKGTSLVIELFLMDIQCSFIFLWVFLAWIDTHQYPTSRYKVCIITLFNIVYPWHKMVNSLKILSLHLNSQEIQSAHRTDVVPIEFDLISFIQMKWWWHLSRGTTFGSLLLKSECRNSTGIQWNVETDSIGDDKE